VLVGRSPEKTNRIAAELEADSHIADFADLGAIRELAATLQAKYPRIDVLANNAGESPPRGPGKSPSTGTRWHSR
jgi:NAD(P)-dependent dehydrogenase (short-subunit alcohol dehydrogenase family)